MIVVVVKKKKVKNIDRVKQYKTNLKLCKGENCMELANEKCFKCGGIGFLTSSNACGVCEGRGSNSRGENCVECEGRGEENKKLVCDVCGGTGEITVCYPD